MYSRSNPTDALITAIDNFPTEWALTPCKGKANQWKNWPHERLERNKLIEAIRTQKNAEGKHTAWTGVSIVTGPMSDGIMAVDFDGGRALQKYTELSGGKLPPTTKKWTSGKPGHFQILLQVPPEKWEGLQPKKIDLENGEKLELRWNQCSTLPPSIHPDTGNPYVWKNDGAIAEAPDFILQLMKESPAVALPKTPAVQTTQYIDIETSLVDLLENTILPHLDAEEFYGNWSALKPSGKNFVGLCPFHKEETASFTVSPEKQLFKCFGCGAGGGPVQFLHQIKGGTGSPTGKEFYEVVMELAGKVGVQMPDRQQPRTQNLKSNSQNPKPNNLLKHPANYTPEPAPATEIIEHADQLLEEELTPTNQIIGAIAAAKRAGLSAKDFREILAERQAEQDLDWSLIESRENFQRLYQIEKTQINLHEIFPPALAKALLSKAESDRVDPVRILQSLLPVVGATLGGRIGIELKKGFTAKDSHIEYPIFYCADIGHPSTGKSATQGTLVESLQEMQDAEQERLEFALVELEQVMDNWKSLSKEEKSEKADSEENPRIFEEKYCRPKKWLLEEASAQALTKRISEQSPMHGCLLLQDELAGMFDSMDQFTGGKGGQRQFILKAWNKPLRGSVDRVDLQASYYFKSQTLSLTGTIQPAVARRIFNTTADPDGMLSRFLPAIASIPDNFDQPPTVRVNVYSAIKSVIEKLQGVPENLLTLPAATAEIFWSHWHNLRRGQKANFDSNPAYSYFLGKQISYVGRFAIVVHCLENLGVENFPTQVSAETMRKAVRLSNFYCSQFLLLQSKSAQQQPLEGLLLDILKFVQQQGGTISTRDLRRSRFKKIHVEGKPLTPATAEKLLREIAAAGFGTFEQVGKAKILSLVPIGIELAPIGIELAPNWHQLESNTSKGLSENWHELAPASEEVYVSKNSEPRTENFSEAFIEESDNNFSEISKTQEDIENWHKMPIDAQTPTQQGLPLVPIRCQLVPIRANSILNVDEAELLGMLHTAIEQGDPVLAQNVRGSLKQVCAAGHADRQKVWDALGSENQKIFLELLETKIPSELVDVVEKIEKTLQTERPFMVDELQGFAPQQVIDATKFLKPTDKTKLAHWMAIRKLAKKLEEAFEGGVVAAIVEIAKAHSEELVEAALVRMVALGLKDEADEIREVLS